MVRLVRLVDDFDRSLGMEPDGSKFDLWTPALNSIGFRLDELCLTPDLRVPPTEVGHTDDQLAKRLGRVWHLRYRRGEAKRATARVFRSLEAAFAALGLRFRSYSSLSEIGLNAVPWATGVDLEEHWPRRPTRVPDGASLRELLEYAVRESQGPLRRPPSRGHRQKLLGLTTPSAPPTAPSAPPSPA